MNIVIFAGGVGTRLWPLSRKNAPKQFETIVGDKSMLQAAVERLFPGFPWEKIYISTGKNFAKQIKEHLPQLQEKNIIEEPSRRDIGPAVGLVVAHFAKKSPNEPIALLWGSDHLVKKEEEFRQALLLAEQLVKKNPQKIIFIGQKPRFPSQNLGYIEFGDVLTPHKGMPVHAFKSFTYSPDLDTAKTFIEDGCHAWNLGYFVSTPKFLWRMFEEFAPSLFEQLLKIYNSIDTPGYGQVLSSVYPHLEKISFDHAILEKMNQKDGMVISVDIGWSDIGTWEALKEALSDRSDENVTKGKVMLEDSKDTLVFNYTDQLSVGIDLNEIFVINTKDVVLICPKASMPKIKEFVKRLAGTSYEHLA